MSITGSKCTVKLNILETIDTNSKYATKTDNANSKSKVLLRAIRTDYTYIVELERREDVLNQINISEAEPRPFPTPRSS